MVERELVFKRYNSATGETDLLPITETELSDPQYTGLLLFPIMKYGLPEYSSPKNELGKTAIALSKVGRPRWWERGSKPVYSVYDLASMTDQELLDSHAQWLGSKRISLFRKAWQTFQGLRQIT